MGFDRGGGTGLAEWGEKSAAEVDRTPSARANASGRQCRCARALTGELDLRADQGLDADVLADVGGQKLDFASQPTCFLARLPVEVLRLVVGSGELRPRPGAGAPGRNPAMGTTLAGGCLTGGRSIQPMRLRKVVETAP